MKADQGIYAEIGDDVNYQGWADADARSAMVAGQKSVSENVPERIFDRANVGSISADKCRSGIGRLVRQPEQLQDSIPEAVGREVASVVR